jgi:hypothetical protein
MRQYGVAFLFGGLGAGLTAYFLHNIAGSIVAAGAMLSGAVLLSAAYAKWQGADE